MLIGYLWASTADSQDCYDQQHQALLRAGVAESQICADINCLRQERPELQRCLQALGSEDTLVVWRLERLVNSRAHLVEVLTDLGLRGIGLKVLMGQGAVIDTDQMDLQVIVQVLEALTELENQIVREATIEGLAAARARGQALGPRRKMTAEMVRQAMANMTDSSLSASQIAEKLGVTRATLYNYLNGDGSPKPAALKLLQPEQ